METRNGLLTTVQRFYYKDLKGFYVMFPRRKNETACSYFERLRTWLKEKDLEALQ